MILPLKWQVLTHGISSEMIFMFTPVLWRPWASWRLNSPAPVCSPHRPLIPSISWWRHQMETFSALLALCAGNSPISGEFPAQRAVTQSFAVFFDLRLNKRLSKQSWDWWFETLSNQLWRHCNVNNLFKLATQNMKGEPYWPLVTKSNGDRCVSPVKGP